MKSLLVICLILVVSLFCSCECQDCEPLMFDFHYINNTGTPVEITIDYGTASIESVDERIEVDDTLKLEYAEAELEGGVFGEQVSLELKIMAKTSRCITYSGAAIDSVVDPRFRDNWMQYASAWDFIINDSLYAYAEFCD